MMTKETLYVEFIGRPSAGKSTTAFTLFSQLKREGDYKVEFVGEYAKELVYKGFDKELSNQLAVTAEQNFREDVLNGVVDIVITDTSTLLGNIYNDTIHPEVLENLIDDLRKRKKYLTVLVTNSQDEYKEYGRTQSKEEAFALADKIEGFVRDKTNNIINFDKYQDIGDLVESVKDCVNKKLF